MSYFNSQETKTEDEQDQGNQEDWLTKVVQDKGEHWQDPQVIAKGYVAAQEHIKNLERQIAEAGEDLEKRKYVEDLVEQLRQAQATPSAGTPDAGKQSGDGQENTTPKPDEESLKSLIEETLTQREQQNSRQQNLSFADKKLEELYGTEAASTVEQRSKELGMSKDRLTEIASESPTAFFKLIGEEVKREPNPVTGGTVNTSAQGFANQSNQQRNFSYYQKMRREDPRNYYSPKVQNQMLQDRTKLGEDFYN